MLSTCHEAGALARGCGLCDLLALGSGGMIAALLPTTVLDIAASASVMLIGATCPEELGRGRLAPRLVELGPYEPAPGNAGSIPPYGWEPPIAMTLGRASVPGAVETSPPHAGPELSPLVPLG